MWHVWPPVAREARNTRSFDLMTWLLFKTIRRKPLWFSIQTMLWPRLNRFARLSVLMRRRSVSGSWKAGGKGRRRRGRRIQIPHKQNKLWRPRQQIKTHKRTHWIFLGRFFFLLLFFCTLTWMPNSRSALYLPGWVSKRFVWSINSCCTNVLTLSTERHLDHKWL